LVDKDRFQSRRGGERGGGDHSLNTPTIVKGRKKEKKRKGEGKRKFPSTFLPLWRKEGEKGGRRREKEQDFAEFPRPNERGGGGEEITETVINYKLISGKRKERRGGKKGGEKRIRNDRNLNSLGKKGRGKKKKKKKRTAFFLFLKRGEKKGEKKKGKDLSLTL